MIGDVEGRDPVAAFDELEASACRVKIEPQEKRKHKGDERHPERRPTGIAGDLFLGAANHQDPQRPDQWEEGRHGEDWPGLGHHRLAERCYVEVPGDQRDNANQHGEGVVVEVAALERTRA